jgi:hypothetical protein
MYCSAARTVSIRSSRRMVVGMAGLGRCAMHGIVPRSQGARIQATSIHKGEKGMTVMTPRTFGTADAV